MTDQRNPVESTVRDYSVYPAWIVGEPHSGYLKIRSSSYSMGIGTRVEIQRRGETIWLPARRVEPLDSTGGGGIVWLELIAE